jgi:Putative zinc-finger
MSVFGCLWNRPRLDRYTDEALAPRLVRAVKAHLTRCGDCSGYVERQARLRQLVKSAVPDDGEPDWNGFWPGILTTIAREKPRRIKDPWWIPLWRPFWGHPRLALGGAMVAGLALALVFWPVGDNPGSVAWAGPITVQDVSTPDPDQSVMVYSSPDHALTVIWLFSPGTTTDQS